ncbi:tail fiber assembly protein [Rhizobium sp. HT1-10]|uniref:tail fiber assembly protein n=1 Tax=Rhizobium sp. HT1-10 TaxID=3111638 RepID=UPI003C1FBF6A
MAIFYSAKTGGFYDPEIVSEMPSDAVEISSEEYSAVLEEQSAGKEITPDGKGKPVASSVGPMTEDAARAQRDILLRECDWTQLDDVAINKARWATYRQALRDVTAQTGFPAKIKWPTKP